MSEPTPQVIQAFAPTDYRPAQVPSGVTLQPVNLPPERVQELRKRAKESLFFFAKAILDMRDLSPSFHGPICRMLENRSNQFCKIVMPRSTFKSSLCTVAYAVWEVLNNPNIRICIAQNTSTNADKKLSEIGDIFTKNPLFRALFPELVPTKEQRWKENLREVPRDKPSPEGTFESIGVKTGVISRHYDIVIEDDTVSPDADELGEVNIAPTKDDIGKAIGFHKSTTSLFYDQQTCRNIVVGTRWFDHDLMSWIDQNDTDFAKYERGMLETNGVPDPNGTPSFPEKFPLAVVERIRKKYGPYMFSCLYLNKPIPSANQLFQLDWFSFYEVEPPNLIVTTTVDPGGDAEDSAGDIDYNVVLTTGKDQRTGIIYVLEVSRFHSNPGILLDVIHRHVQKWHPLKVGIEAVQYQKKLLYWNREKMARDDHWFNVEPIQNNRLSKNARICGLQPQVEQKLILFRTHQMDLITEMLQFPNGSHDDMADALSMHLPLWSLTMSDVETAETTPPDPHTLEAHLMEHQHEYEQSQTEANPVFDYMGRLPVGAEFALSN